MAIITRKKTKTKTRKLSIAIHENVQSQTVHIFKALPMASIKTNK